MNIFGNTLRIKGVCNTNCSFCNFYEIKGEANPENHFLELQREIDELKRNGESYLNIGINGYEPTAFKYFIDVLKYAKSKNFHITLLTNGVRLADETYASNLKGLVDKVFITLYSSNDREHMVLTQNNDSRLIKHYAILNCLKYEIEVNISILLLKTVVQSLEKIMIDCLEYADYNFFSKKISLTVPSAWMGEQRNKVLIPSYTSIIVALNKIFQNNAEIFHKKKVSFILNGIIPPCLLKINNDSGVLGFSKFEKNVRGNMQYFHTCNGCKYRDKCNGVEKEYVAVYGESEFIEGKNILKETSIDDTESALLSIRKQFVERGMWMSYEFIEKEDPKFLILTSIEKGIFGYTIQEVLVKNNILSKIRFLHTEKNDTFTVSIDYTNGQYVVKIDPGYDEKRLKIYKLILYAISGYFNSPKYLPEKP